jgi:hypothetical protein
LLRAGICFLKVSLEVSSGGIAVQTSHRENPVLYAAQQVVRGGPALGIFVGGQVALGLVEQQIDFLAGRERAAIERDAVVRRIDPEFRRLNFLAVHGDAARADPALSLGARHDQAFAFGCLACLGRGSIFMIVQR